MVHWTEKASQIGSELHDMLGACPVDVSVHVKRLAANIEWKVEYSYPVRGRFQNGGKVYEPKRRQVVHRLEIEGWENKSYIH